MRSKCAVDWVLPIAVALDMLGFGMLIPDVQLRAEAIGLRGWQIGFVLSSMFLVQSIVSPAWGRYADRTGRRRVFILCTLLSASSMGIYAIATNSWLILASRVCAGLGAANVSSAYALLSVSTPEEKRSEAMGRMGAASMLGLSLGPAIGGQLVAHGGQMLLGLVGAMSSAMAVLLVTFCISVDTPANYEGQEGKKRSLELLRSVPALAVIAGIATVAWFALASLEGTFGRLIKHNLGLGQKEFGLIFGFESLLGFLVQIALVEWVSKRASSRRILALSYLSMGIGLGLMPVAPSFGFLLLTSVFYAVGSGLANPKINELAADATPEARRGEAYGLLQATRSLGFILGPALGGLLFDHAVWAPYALAAAVCALAAASAMALAPKWNQATAKG